MYPVNENHVAYELALGRYVCVCQLCGLVKAFAEPRMAEQFAAEHEHDAMVETPPGGGGNKALNA